MVTANIIDTRETVVARRPFCFDGVQYNRDDEFPWLDIGAEERRVHQLFDQGYLIPKRMRMDTLGTKEPWEDASLTGRALWQATVKRAQELGVPSKGGTSVVTERIKEHLAK